MAAPDEPVDAADPTAASQESPEIVISEGQLRIPIDDDDSGRDPERQLAEPIALTGDEPPRMRRVWMRNFKGFRDFSASLGTFNVLAGANNSGKSTLLQGIDLLFSLLKLHREGDGLASSGRLVPPSILPVATVRDLYYQQMWRPSKQAHSPGAMAIGSTTMRRG